MSTSGSHPHIHTTALQYVTADGHRILDTDELVLGPGKHGVSGENGSGKTTWLRLLAGELTPTSGKVSVQGSVALLPQIVLDQGPATEHTTIAEVLGIDRVIRALRRIEAGSVEVSDYDTVDGQWDAHARSAAALEAHGLDNDLDRSIATLSGGQLVQLRLASITLTQPDIVLLDEPTNNLDATARQMLITDLVDAWDGPLVVVSHDVELLEHMDHIGHLHDGRFSWYPGGWSQADQARQAEQSANAARVASARAEVRRQQRAAESARTRQERRDRRGRAAADSMPRILAGKLKRHAQESAGRSADVHSQRMETAREDLLEAQEVVHARRTIDVDLPGTLVPPRRRVLSASGLRPQHAQVRLDLELTGTERVVLTGPNGVGKTSLLRAIAGLDPVRDGTVSTFVPVQFLPQNLDILTLELSAYDNVRRVAAGADPNAIRAQLAKLRLRGALADVPTRHLSGGQRWRAALACLLLAEPTPQLLILDEPTNSLDPDSRQQLISALAAFGGAVLAASHDESFINDVGFRRLEVVPD